MVSLESLLSELSRLDAQNDLEGLRRVREQIADDHSDSEAAVEANYKLGLNLLFNERNLTAWPNPLARLRVLSWVGLSH